MMKTLQLVVVFRWWLLIGVGVVLLSPIVGEGVPWLVRGVIRLMAFVFGGDLG